MTTKQSPNGPTAPAKEPHFPVRKVTEAEALVMAINAQTQSMSHGRKQRP